MDTSERLLKLLSLLQARPDWTGPELAERLEVSGRTVRNDVERLRRLGYPVQASPGVGGGYRLGAGAALPPLLLDDEEAVAVAVGLRTAAGGGVAGIEETSLRALVKLEQVLPSRLRHRVNALHSAMAAVQGGGPTLDAEVLTAIAAAIRDRQRLRFDYRLHGGSAGVRDVEPHRVVSWGRRWYLVAFDADRQDWRTFRVDRVVPRAPTGPRFTPRRVPGGDVTAYVERTVGRATWRYRPGSWSTPRRRPWPAGSRRRSSWSRWTTAPASPPPGPTTPPCSPSTWACSTSTSTSSTPPSWPRPSPSWPPATPAPPPARPVRAAPPGPPRPAAPGRPGSAPARTRTRRRSRSRAGGRAAGPARSGAGRRRPGTPP